jgi:radical SAM-linked protein
VAGEESDRGNGVPVRLRVRYSKTGKIRFTSHRDVVRMWERGLRRSGLPFAWSAGYSPRPLLSFGHALPTGAESLAEYLDVSLAPGAPAPSTPDALARSLSALLPDGLDVQAISPIPTGSGSLQQEVSSISWKLEVFGLAAEELASRVERLLAAPRALVERERKGRSAPDDLRPALLALAVVPRADGVPDQPDTHEERVWLEAELATRPRGVRPRELLEVLGPGVRLSRASRMHQWIERDGTRVEPLEICGRRSGTVAARAVRRAS